MINTLKHMNLKMVSLTLLLWASCFSHAEQLRVAVASNFMVALQQLAIEFKQYSGHDLVISSASTGQLFAQIKQAAPFDVFMSADTLRPQLLVDQGLARDYQIYAHGQLVLLSNQSSTQPCEGILTSDEIKYLAVANPNLAPYGLAAQQFLQAESLWQALSKHLVMGENISQTMQMVDTQNATAGLVAQSLVINRPLRSNQCTWPVPVAKHDPLEQAMVLLKRSKKQHVYGQFVAFLTSSVAKEIMLEQGYSVASNND